MKAKIKNLFTFFYNAWISGPRGKWGIVFVLVATFFFVGLFYGTNNIQSFIVNAWHLKQERVELDIAQKQLRQIQQHIYLLQHPNSSSDYIEELGLHTLNLGNPEFKELKY